MIAIYNGGCEKGLLRASAIPLVLCRSNICVIIILAKCIMSKKYGFVLYTVIFTLAIHPKGSGWIGYLLGVLCCCPGGLFLALLYYIEKPSDDKPKKHGIISRWMNTWFEKTINASVSVQNTGIKKSAQDDLSDALAANSILLVKTNRADELKQRS